MPRGTERHQGGEGRSVKRRIARQLAQAYKTCAECLQRQGVDLAGYTILEVITDLEAARTALGYARMHLLSRS